MAQPGKLRVAVKDGAEALDLVRAEVQHATGLISEPYFQEIERPGQLLVEIRLSDAGGRTPTEVAKMVATGSRRLDVLSAWSEPVQPVPVRPVQHHITDLLQCEDPDLALRAHHDGLPTARWHFQSRTKSPHWLLAVPVIDAERKPVVGICRRSGYYYRFSASEASSLVSPPARAPQTAAQPRPAAVSGPASR